MPTNETMMYVTLNARRKPLRWITYGRAGPSTTDVQRGKPNPSATYQMQPTAGCRWGAGYCASNATKQVSSHSSTAGGLRNKLKLEKNSTSGRNQTRRTLSACMHARPHAFWHPHLFPASRSGGGLSRMRAGVHAAQAGRNTHVLKVQRREPKP